MSFNYAKSAATATRLIAKFGQKCTIRQRTVSGSRVSPTVTYVDTEVIAVDLSKNIRDAGGTLTGESRRTLYISTSSGVVPSKADKIVVGITPAEVTALEAAQENISWHEISQLRPLSPAGVDVMYEADLAG